VFAGEIAISVSSLVFVIFLHSNTFFLPFAYFAGYLVAFIMLFAGSFKHFSRWGYVFGEEMKRIYKNFLELFIANQIGSLNSIVDRFFQSFLLSGSISVLSFSSTLTTNLGGLLSFRDIFLVPLSVKKNQSERLERVMIILTIISIPIMFFVSFYSKDIITFLFKRGKFDANATDITAAVLAIYAFSIFPAVAGLPAFRMFQAIDCIKYTAMVYLFGLINFVILGAVFIFYLKWGVYGMALVVVLCSYLMNMFCLFLLHKERVRLNYARMLKYAAYAFCASLLVVATTKIAPIPSMRFPASFLVNGSLYFILLTALYLPLKSRIMSIVR